MHRFHHSRENRKLREPTNWLWAESDGDFVSKVDDDCIVAPDWLDVLRRPYDDFDGFGVLGSWRFPDEDFDPELAAAKIQEFPGGHRVLRNHWVQGSGYLLPARLVERHGALRADESFTATACGSPAPAPSTAGTSRSCARTTWTTRGRRTP